jgi:hypothetical protein
MIPQLLKTPTYSPVSDAYAYRHTQGDDCSAPAKRKCQWHSYEGHYDDAERVDVFALNREDQRRHINAALFRRL